MPQQHGMHFWRSCDVDISIARGITMKSVSLEAVMRLLCSKSLDTEFSHSVPGKWSQEKMMSLVQFWLKHINGKFPELDDILTKFGVDIDGDKPGADEDEEARILSNMCFVVTTRVA